MRSKSANQNALPVLSLVSAALLICTGATAQAAAVARPAAAVIAASTLRGARDLGRAGDMRVDFSVVLPYRHPADLPYLLEAQRSPASKYYRRFLKAAEFRNYFSPSLAAYSTAAQALRRAGFVVDTFANRTVLHAYGKSSTAERYFASTIDRVREANGQLAYANVTPATIPAALAGARVVGLNGIVMVHAAASAPAAPVRPKATTSGPLFGPDGGFGPLAIAKVEDFPVEHGYRGTNSNVADIIDGSVSDADVATFLHAFGMQRSGPRTTTVLIDNGGCYAYCANAYQAALDAEWILAMAPGASLFTYEVSNLSNGDIVDAFNTIASQDAINIVNIPFAACEVTLGDLELALEPLVAQGEAEGITYESNAYGGANACGLPPLDLPVAFANLDTVTAVGASSTFVDNAGTQLYETAFGTSNGGVSAIIPLPRWQSKTPGIVAGGRNVPDVVIPAEVDGTGASVYWAGAWVGGTPFVSNAPFAGYLATVQEMYGYATPLGNVAPALYATFNTFGYRAGGTVFFEDIRLGCIGGAGPVPACAKTGYDVASGIGSIAGGYALAKALNFGPIAPPAR